MTKAITARTLATAAVAATASLATSPAGAASHQPAHSSPQGFVPKPTPATTAGRGAARSLGPDTVSHCASANGVTECGKIVGTGSNVSSAQIYHACVLGSGMWIRAVIVSPGGFSASPSRAYYRSDGNCIPNLTLIEGNDDPGTWKFLIKRVNANQTYTTIDTVTAHVD
jgi:hypothetical protein